MLNSGFHDCEDRWHAERLANIRWNFQLNAAIKFGLQKFGVLFHVDDCNHALKKSAMEEYALRIDIGILDGLIDFVVCAFFCPCRVLKSEQTMRMNMSFHHIRKRPYVHVLKK